MKTTQLLRSLLGIPSSCDGNPEMTYNMKANELYGVLCEILLKTVTEEHKQLILALDDIIGILISNTFDSSVISGLKLANQLKTILNKPESVHNIIINNSNKTNTIYEDIYTVINKYKQILD